ncbi:MAG: PAS domain-containing protein [Parvibaculum sp.]|uniref:PAS domain-containing protein n=1 Tax=Parvibaculum sp. TaxID=2024848 RepID=UPI0032EF6E7F
MLAFPDFLRTAGARRFFSYWDSLLKEGFAPDRKDFSPAAIAPLMPAVTILEIVSDELVVQRLAGTAVCRAMGFDPTGGNALDLVAPEARPHYLSLLHAQTTTPCGRWNMLRVRRENLVERAEVLTLPMYHSLSGHWMILSYFGSIETVAYEHGPYEILAYEDTQWIDLGAGIPDLT